MLIANMLTTIRNGQAVRKDSVKAPYSNFAYELAKKLEEGGYLRAVSKKGRGAKRILEIDLKYDEDGSGAIHEVSLVSKPGRRVYMKSTALRPYKEGRGLRIVSTPQGLKTDKEARKARAGGEVVCEVW